MGLLASPYAPHGPLDRDVFGHHVVTGVTRVLQLGRQGDPQLERLHATLLRSAGMPDPIARPHPLHATRRQQTFPAGRLRVADVPLEHHRHRRDAGMRVPSEAHGRGRKSTVEGGEVQEHEGLDELAQVGGTHQSSDGPLGVPARAMDDFTDGILNAT